MVKGQIVNIPLVRVASITEFERVNEHTPNPIVEQFYCITMLDPKGAAFVTFTRVDTVFASQLQVGDEFELSGKFKRHQTHNDLPSTVLTNCIHGKYKDTQETREARRKEKARKRMAKLGL